MSKFKKDMQSRIKQAAQSGSSLEDRFKRAQDVLDRQPTGFALPAAPEAGSSARRAGRAVQIATVPIEQVDPNPYNARRIYRQEHISELAVSIAASGQLVPAIATPRGERYVLVAGHYRLKALRMAGLEHIDLMLHEGLSDQELYQYSFRENTERSEQSALDNALVWRDLLEQKVYPNETALAEATGLSLPNINKTLQILRLSPPVIELVSQQPENFAMSALYELVLLEACAGAKLALQMAERLSKGEAGRKDVQELRARHETPKLRKRKENSRQYRIRVGETQIGTIKEWDSGRIALDIVVVDSAERSALIDELKRRFGVEVAE